MRGDHSEPVPSEAGAWPHFYAALERALRDGAQDDPYVAQEQVVADPKLREAELFGCLRQFYVA